MPENHGLSASVDGRYMALTQGIRVLVEPCYLEEQSKPAEGQYLWAYSIEIRNESPSFVQLTHRCWEITDCNGEIHHVQGSGVVGEQPVLHPGESYQYTSACPLGTNSGFMTGYYTMQGPDGETFDIDIPAFALDLPNANHIVN
jgi:ApaG protein